MITRQPGNRGTLRVALGSTRLRVEVRTLALAGAVTVLTLGFGLVALGTGTIRLAPVEVIDAMLHRGEDRTELVVWTIRLPRLAAGVLVGMALGAAGCVFQSVSRNALGSPDIIGFTTGAATGAVIQIVFFNRGSAATALAAVLAGMLTATAVYLLSRNRGATGGNRLVLTGIGVAAMLSALNTMVLAHGNLDLAVKARIWLSGSLNARQWLDVLPVAVGVALVLPLLVWLSRHLDVLEMGDDQARQLGVDAERARLAVMLGGVVLTAVAVAAAGPIAFVALAAPQIVRRLTHAARVQVIGSALFGAVLLVGADLLSQLLPVDAALPVGLTTGVIGGVYLLWVLSRQKAV